MESFKGQKFEKNTVFETLFAINKEKKNFPANKKALKNPNQ